MTPQTTTLIGITYWIRLNYLVCFIINPHRAFKTKNAINNNSSKWLFNARSAGVFIMQIDNSNIPQSEDKYTKHKDKMFEKNATGVV